MKQVQYIGEKGINYARIGILNGGEKLDLYEWEWLAEKDGSSFKLLTPPYSEQELEVAKAVKPTGSRFFDLRTIPWESPKLRSLFSSRMSSTVLMKIINAINDVGGNITQSSRGEHKNVLIDRIFEAAYLMGWNKYTKEERLAFAGEPPSTSTTLNVSNKATRQRMRKTVEHGDDNDS
jgi:hypothetical protein